MASQLWLVFTFRIADFINDSLFSETVRLNEFVKWEHCERNLRLPFDSD